MKWLYHNEPLFVFLILLLDVAFITMYIDDLYGWTQMRKHSKRMIRRWHRQFMKTAKQYMSKKNNTNTEGGQ